MEWSQVITATEKAVRNKKTNNFHIFESNCINLTYSSNLNIQFVG